MRGMRFPLSVPLGERRRGWTGSARESRLVYRTLRGYLLRTLRHEDAPKQRGKPKTQCELNQTQPQAGGSAVRTFVHPSAGVPFLLAPLDGWRVSS